MTALAVEHTAKTRGNRDRSDGLVPKWVESSKQASEAAGSEHANIVWIIRKSSLADSVAHRVAELHSFKKTGYLVLLLNARSALLPPLEKRFRVVACAPTALLREELEEVLKAPDRQDRFIGGTADPHSKTLTLWRGDFNRVVVPFEAFPPTGNGLRPRFDKFSVTDYGRTLRFGEYESSADAVLFESAPDFRRRLKQTRFAQEQTLGASIRRLRKQRRLTLNDFDEIDPKTLARIEHGKVQNPRSETLSQIARALRVPQEQLGSY